MSKSKATLKTQKSKGEYELNQKLLSDDDHSDDDLGLPWRLNREPLTDSYNNNTSIAPAKYLLRMLTSIGLCFSVIFIVFDSFNILLSAAILDNLLSVIMMVLSLVYQGKCPLQKNLSPALFAYAFTSLVKSVLSIWNNRDSFKTPDSSTDPLSSTRSGARASPPEAKSPFGKRLQFILFNGLQLICLAFFIFSCIVVLPLYPAMHTDPQPEGLNSTRHCNKVLYWYSFSFLTLNALYMLAFLSWIPCILFCLLGNQ